MPLSLIFAAVFPGRCRSRRPSNAGSRRRARIYRRDHKKTPNEKWVDRAAVHCDCEGVDRFRSRRRWRFHAPTHRSTLPLLFSTASTRYRVGFRIVIWNRARSGERTSLKATLSGSNNWRPFRVSKIDDGIISRHRNSVICSFSICSGIDEDRVWFIAKIWIRPWSGECTRLKGLLSCSIKSTSSYFLFVEMESYLVIETQISLHFL